MELRDEGDKLDMQADLATVTVLELMNQKKPFSESETSLKALLDFADGIFKKAESKLQ